MHILDEVIIVVIQAVEYMGGEVFITKRLTDRGQCVGETSHIVEVVCDAEAIKLGLPQLAAYIYTKHAPETERQSCCEAPTKHP